MTIGQIAVFAVVIVSALGCLRGVLREARGEPMRLWRLFATPLLALGTAVVLLLFPTTESNDIVLWGMTLVIGLAVGVARGFFINFQVDHQWHLIRLLNASDGRSSAIALVVLGALEIVAALWQPAGSPYHPLLAACTATFAGFLVGRVATVLSRARQESHFELRAQ